MSMYWITALSLGFLSSLHCIGMCGPIALALPLNRRSALTMMGGLLINNFSRIAGYALLGLLAGTLGKGLVIAGLQSYLSVISGGLMLLSLLVSYIRFPASGLMHKVTGAWKVTAAKLFGISSPYTLSLIGLLNAFLPCGFVYMALAGATGTGHILSGAAFMICFGIGTSPALIAVAFSRQFVQPRLREKIRRFAPVFVSILACILILRGLNLDIPYLSPKADDSGIHACCKK